MNCKILNKQFKYLKKTWFEIFGSVSIEFIEFIWCIL